ncbi:MAG: dTDP-4-dehydrorhamnose 3,5-epimerase [Rhodospirillales bacterium CG15_BIG_FIL_POST_REV_8_21_14_020_66_15]|nr:MAG: dTDP-4-dehydrorhamnose 3,5-epimerase [Rhodospirillales bacterium CG15_BIG_FIL_POST_REV_8_21_14_020_66_15]
MAGSAIHGVVVTPLSIIRDGRGAVMHMLRADAPHFTAFGEIYFTTVDPGAVKAWKRHREMTLNLCCVVGTVRLALFDDRDGSATRGAVQEIVLSPDVVAAYCLVTVPPGIWTGFACAGDTPALMANCASLPHDPTEADGLPAETGRIPYHWPART